MEVENRLRKFLGEILAPFTDRIQQLNSDLRQVKTQQDTQKGQLTQMQQRIEVIKQLDTHLSKQQSEILQLVSYFGSVFVGRETGLTPSKKLSRRASARFNSLHKA